jgi:hypothetical protein
MVGIGRGLTQSSRSEWVSSGLSRHDRCVWTRPRFSQNGRGEIGSRRCAKFTTASSVNAKAKQRQVCDEDGERMIQHGLLVVEECRGFVGTKTRLGGCSFPRLNLFEVAIRNLSASTLSDCYCPMLELYCPVSTRQSHPVSTRNIRSRSFLVSCALQSSHQPSLE